MDVWEQCRVFSLKWGKSNLGAMAVCSASCNTILFVEWGVFLKWHSVSGQQSSSCAYLCIQGGCSVIKAHWCSCVWTGRLQFDQWLEALSSQQNGGKELSKIPVEFFKEGGGWRGALAKNVVGHKHGPESLKKWQFYVGFTLESKKRKAMLDGIMGYLSSAWTVVTVAILKEM